MVVNSGKIYFSVRRANNDSDVAGHDEDAQNHSYEETTKENTLISKEKG